MVQHNVNGLLFKNGKGRIRDKKEALIKGLLNELNPLAECKNESDFKNFKNAENE